MNTMRPIRLNARLPVIAALGAAVAAIALIATPGSARAGDDQPFDEQILHNIMTGLGLQDPNAAQPSYHERPPLVLPQSDALPPPQKPGAAIANNPAWPKDPDIQRAKLLAKQDKNRNLEDERLRDRNPLRPDQIGPQYPDRRQARRSSSGDAPISNPEDNHKMTPSQLGYVGGLFGNMFGSDKDERTAQFTGEPARTSLTEPPPGYQTPSPDQPYGLGKAAPPKAENSYLKRVEASQDGQ